MCPTRSSLTALASTAEDQTATEVMWMDKTKKRNEKEEEEERMREIEKIRERAIERNKKPNFRQMGNVLPDN